MGIMPGLRITLEQRFPSYIIKIGEMRGGMRIAIDRTLARAIYVRRTR